MQLPDSSLASADPGAREPLDPAPIEPLLARRLSSARARWPGVALPEDVLARFVGERLPAGVDPASALQSLQVDELYLACACSRWEPAAIRLLQLEYFPLALASLARMRLAPHQVDEVKQALLEQLLIGNERGRPTILTYGGQGDFASWISVCAVRLAYRLLRREERHRGDGDDDVLLSRAADGDLEAHYCRKSCRWLLRQSLHEAVGSLAAHERAVLHEHHLQGLTIRETGRRHGVHRATAARWLAEARRKLRDRTYEALGRRMTGHRSELTHVIQSAVDMAGEDASDASTDLTVWSPSPSQTFAALAS